MVPLLTPAAVFGVVPPCTALDVLFIIENSLPMVGHRAALQHSTLPSILGAIRAANPGLEVSILKCSPTSYCTRNVVRFGYFGKHREQHIGSIHFQSLSVTSTTFLTSILSGYREIDSPRYSYQNRSRSALIGVLPIPKLMFFKHSHSFVTAAVTGH